MPNNERTQPFRDSKQLLNMPRGMGRSHARTQTQLLREAQPERKSFPARAMDYLKIKVVRWVWHYVRSRFGKRHTFQEYESENDTGIYELSVQNHEEEPVKVSLVGDWGTGTSDANEIANLVESSEPHFTIHLGDIYYVGTKKEITENMFDIVKWPIGSRGSFSLNSNHEMYAKGEGYFEVLLPKLGIRNNAGSMPSGQHASFFCLRNAHWLVLGLDTGYHSVGIPILEFIVKPSCKLDKKLVKWLREVVRLQEDQSRGIVILTHHQYFSAFDNSYEKAARQLSQFLSRPVLWFWGHEHRLALYGKHVTPKGRTQAYGRCIGHGGMPIEDIGDKPQEDERHRVKLVFYDKRKRSDIDGETSVGFNGFANLVFEGNRLTIEYRDIDNQVLVEELWEVEDQGVLRGKSIQQKLTHQDLALYTGSLDDALR